MVERSVLLLEQGQEVGVVRGKGSVRHMEELPLEVVTLLGVFAGIEMRRQVRLREKRKEVN